MKHIFYLHWHEAELAECVQTLRGAGYEVSSHWDTQIGAKIPEPYPDCFIVSLDRLPSHGHAFAGWVVEAKKRQHIPLIFVGGKPEKVSAKQAKFPRALYCGDNELPVVLERLASGELKYPAAEK